MAQLTLIRGIPGSGKTTYAKKNFNCLILEQDMFHMRNGKYQWKAEAMCNAVDWCRKMTRDAIRLGMDVCVVNTFTKKKFIEIYRQLADDLDASFAVIRMTNEYGNVHNVPSYVLQHMKAGFEDWPNEILMK